jgi:hypothetical protein
MDKDLLLVLIGGLVGLVSSLVTAFITHQLDNRRLKVQLERENMLPREEREREDELRRKERERDDQLRREEREREDQLRREEFRRQSITREVDALFRDIQRMGETLDRTPKSDFGIRQHLERQIEEWTRRRQQLQKEQSALVQSALELESQSASTAAR